MSGWVLAALLVLGLLTPTMDAFLCVADDPAMSASVLAAEDDDAPARQAPAHDDGDALCVHGHCHHWVGVARLAERPAFHLALSFTTPSFARHGVPPSAPQTELFRPPRA